MKMPEGGKRVKANEKRGVAKWMHALHLRITRRAEPQDVTEEVAAVVRRSGCADDACHLYVPHSRAGVTINEGSDPAVAQDIAAEFDRLAPRLRNSAHAAGKSISRVKSALAGSAETV